MQHLGPFGPDFIEEFADRIGLDRDFRPVFGREFRTLNQIGFRAIPFDYGEGVVAMQDCKAHTFDEEVERIVHVVVKEFWDQPGHHGKCSLPLGD
jgi:hypothetical protein